MEISLHRRKRTSNSLVTVKFLIIPVIHGGVIYWLKKVKVVKHFNGFSYQITNVQSV
ncbi:hypothetical protein RRF68_12740 [Tenacibaculum sp. HL-MS23]|uniref:hypothetical protein n=1 Tax=Tenacibaculum TaxID=104267 RepID=UPI0023AFF5F6|nr:MULTISPECIES: hypothetical protein [Tenacibaculum]WNW01818.1 hypothetical protein RRF68_12740 [Tenacibaculum sp. HL-MS23]